MFLIDLKHKYFITSSFVVNGLKKTLFGDVPHFNHKNKKPFFL